MLLSDSGRKNVVLFFVVLPPNADNNYDYKQASPYFRRNRSQISKSQFTEVVERTSVWVDWVIIDSDTLTDCWLTMFRSVPAAIGLIAHAEIVAVPIMVAGLMGKDRSRCSLLAVSDHPVAMRTVNTQGRSDHPRRNDKERPPGQSLFSRTSTVILCHRSKSSTTVMTKLDFRVTFSFVRGRAAPVLACKNQSFRSYLQDSKATCSSSAHIAGEHRNSVLLCATFVVYIFRGGR